MRGGHDPDGLKTTGNPNHPRVMFPVYFADSMSRVGTLVDVVPKPSSISTLSNALAMAKGEKGGYSKIYIGHLGKPLPVLSFPDLAQG